MKKYLINYIFLVAILFALGCDPTPQEKIALIDLNPSSITFLETPYPEYREETLVVGNKGDANLVISSLEITQYADRFSVIDKPETLTIKPKDSVNLTIRYTPTEEGGDPTGVLTIKSNDEYSTEHVVFLKTTVPNAVISVTPEAVEFSGEISVGTPIEREIVVKNIGTSALKFENGENPAVYLGAGTHPAFELIDLDQVRTLEPLRFGENGQEIYDSFTFKLKYTPTGDSDETGTIIIYNNSVNSSPTKIITVEGKSQTCRLLLQPADAYVDFGERPMNSENTYTITLSNAGTGPCIISKVELDETSSASEFEIELPEEPQIPITLETGARYNFKSYFRPTSETGSGGAAGIVNIESDDPLWTDGVKKITLFGSTKEDNSPVCIIENTNGGEAYFEVEPGQIENVECERSGVCSNIQMVSKSYDPQGENITLTWRMVEAPASYTNSDWISYPTRDPWNELNTDKHYVDFYVPYATPPGSRYLVELTVRNTSGLESSCYGEIHGLTGNSLHIELFWENPSDVDLHLTNPTFQSLSINNIDPVNHSLDPDLENFRSVSNTDWWSSGDTGKDCYFGNCKGDGISWGLPGTLDDPRLDRDDIPGTGPENINIEKPQEGWYRVGIHYYSQSSQTRGTRSYVRVYCNGVIAYQGNAQLNATDYWWLVADVYWKPVGDTGVCYVFNDGRVYDAEQGHGTAGYQGDLIEDIEPNQE
ncbi:choice-of-anchor D domain-containing protein [bacterium]|nr:choice-of-anchor D domain-containing protein [bacterium]